MAKQHKFYCTQCGNRTVAKSLGVASETIWAGPNEEISIDFCYEVVKCITCGIVQVYEYEGGHEGDWDRATLLYPTTRTLPKEIPVAIAREFREAQKIERISRPAYAVLLGRVLERMFKDKGAKGNTLGAQIKDLTAKNALPVPIIEMSGTLKFLRNKGGHVDAYEIEEDELEVMKDLVIMLLEYVYVAPAKHERLRASIEKKQEGLKGSGMTQQTPNPRVI